MKKNLFSLAKLFVLFITIGTIFSACTKKEYYETAEVYQQYGLNIKANDWKWNDDLGRYEATATLNGFDNVLYNDAAIVVSAFWNEDGTEIQTSLPYLRTWVDNASSKTFSETISYELYPNSNKILFYIQNSDLIDKTSSLIDYEFKFTAIRNLDK